MITDSRVENQKKLLRVKSDHQLFLIKDITQHVTKILNDARVTKEEFGSIYELLSKENKFANQDNAKLEKLNQLMEDTISFFSHLEQLFHELIDRSITIIENGDLVEKNYASLLQIGNDRGDHQQKITELHELNEEHLRTILKLRKDLKNMKNSKPSSVPILSLEKIHNQSEPYSVVNTIPKDGQERVISGGIVQKSLKSEDNASLVYNESGKEIGRLKLKFKEKEAINEALENEIIRKNEVIRNLHQTLESNQDKEFTDKQDLNEALEQQRSHFQDQFNQLNDQYELKCIEYRKLVDELNSKEKGTCENITDHSSRSFSKNIIDLFAFGNCFYETMIASF